MAKLTPFEKEMLQTIQKYYPVSWHDTESVWNILKSYDKVINCIESAQSFGEGFIECASNFNSNERKSVRKHEGKRKACSYCGADGKRIDDNCHWCNRGTITWAS
jgi:hypothetical protein